MNYFGRNLRPYKANLHTHSTVSDGDYSPAEVIRLYAERGYDLLAFSDHSVANPVSTYDGRGMTLVSGMEIHPWGPRGERWHLLALGLPEDFPDPVTSDDTTPQHCIDAAKAVGAAVFCAHPVYCGFRHDDVARLQRLDGIEVFNSACRFAGKGFNMQIWDELADDGILYNAIAVDDMHRAPDLFNGWTMILTDQPLTQESAVAALKAGDFYATQGPEIHSITCQDGILEADFSPCTEVVGVSTKWRGYPAMWENLTGPDDGIREITHCRLRLKYDIPHSYVRLQLKDRLGHYAWSNPVRFNWP